MAIIISKGGVGATPVQQSGVPNEKYLEQYVANNPQSLPLQDINDDLQLLMMARQFSTSSGPIDVLAIDSEGDIYIIETKLFRNPDKRQVVAQVLDYGAALWRTYTDGAAFLAEVDDLMAGDQGTGFNARAKEAFGLEDEDVSALRDTIRQNISNGNLRFVVLMDILRERLKDLILFLNERSRFTVYAVSMEFYRHEGYEIVIPRLFGAESRPAPPPVIAGEKEFFEDSERHLSKDKLAAVRKVYDFAKQSGAAIDWGRGVRGSFSPKYPHISRRSLFTVTSKGRLRLNFGWLNDTEDASRFRSRCRPRQH